MTDQQQIGGRPYGAGSPPSQQVAWWPVHQFVQSLVQQANYGQLPVAGSPSWCVLGDGDPRKLLAVAVAGEHHVLRVDTAQSALADASRVISSAADWPAVARSIRRRSEIYIPRRRSA